MHAKFHFIIAMIFLVSVSAYSQDGVKIDIAQNSMNLYDANGRLFVNDAIGVDGSPFFNNKWKSGKLKLINGKTYDNVPVRINLLTQEVHYLNQGKTEMAVMPGTIKEVIFTDTVNNRQIQYNFKCGFSPVGGQDEKNFYLVISEGKLNLFESLQKKIREQKDVLSGDVKKEFIMQENYYFFANNILTQTRLNKASLLEKMADQKDKIEDFVKSNKLSYKSDKDVKEIVDYYNSL